VESVGAEGRGAGFQENPAVRERLIGYERAQVGSALRIDRHPDGALVDRYRVKPPGLAARQPLFFNRDNLALPWLTCITRSPI